MSVMHSHMRAWAGLGFVRVYARVRMGVCARVGMHVGVRIPCACEANSLQVKGLGGTPAAL
jgi:hypothetical protein